MLIASTWQACFRLRRLRMGSAQSAVTRKWDLVVNRTQFITPARTGQCAQSGKRSPSKSQHTPGQLATMHVTVCACQVSVSVTLRVNKHIVGKFINRRSPCVLVAVQGYTSCNARTGLLHTSSTSEWPLEPPAQLAKAGWAAKWGLSELYLLVRTRPCPSRLACLVMVVAARCTD